MTHTFAEKIKRPFIKFRRQHMSIKFSGRGISIYGFFERVSIWFIRLCKLFVYACIVLTTEVGHCIEMFTNHQAPDALTFPVIWW